MKDRNGNFNLKHIIHDISKIKNKIIPKIKYQIMLFKIQFIYKKETPDIDGEKILTGKIKNNIIQI